MRQEKQRQQQQQEQTISNVTGVSRLDEQTASSTSRDSNRDKSKGSDMQLKPWALSS